MDPRFVHVANGSSTTRLIQAASIPGRVSLWCDVLYEGPVPGDVEDDELVRLRARFLAGVVSESSADLERGLQGWRDAISDVNSYDELVLWYEHDLFDQLNLIQLLSWMHSRQPMPTTVSLIEIGSFPGYPEFKGLGELSPQDLATLLDRRRSVTAARLDLADRAWSAFRQATPVRLDELRRTDTTAMPFLAAALKRFLEEYPWTRDGLSRSERRLLQLASPGSIDLLTAFRRMQEGETAYYITDLSFLTLLRDCSHCTPPLIAVADASLPVGSISSGTMTITDRGRSALEGSVDRIAQYGIDRWLGGVHLASGRKIWRWDDDRQQIVG